MGCSGSVGAASLQPTEPLTFIRLRFGGACQDVWLPGTVRAVGFGAQQQGRASDDGMDQTRRSVKCDYGDGRAAAGGIDFSCRSTGGLEIKLDAAQMKI